MAGRRPLSPQEERLLLRTVRKLSPRDRALVTTQWFSGFRVSEILALTIGNVADGDGLDGLRTQICLPPRSMKGRRGTTRRVPVGCELTRALSSYLAWLRKRIILDPGLPLFLSSHGGPENQARALTRQTAQKLVHSAFLKAGITDDGRLGTHSLRKTFARRVYTRSGNDLMVLKAALNHQDVVVTQRYLEPDAERVWAAMEGVDFTRKSRLARPPVPPILEAIPATSAISGIAHFPSSTGPVDDQRNVKEQAVSA
jgi:integrase